MEKLVPFKENLCSKYATKMLSIKINNACNRSCPFCVDRGGRKGENINVEKIAEEAIKYDEYKTVIITGGEPFLNFEEVVKLATLLRPYKDRIVVNTNGSLLTPEKVERLNPVIDELQVSVHHYDENRNGKIMGGIVSYQNMKESLANKDFIFSVNSTFNKEYTPEERPIAVDKMIDLCNYLGADRLRLTELKKVDGEDFVLADQFFSEDDSFVNRSSEELITKGCTRYYEKNGVLVSVKRLCQYAKGKKAPAFSCCFINTAGQMKIDVDTKDTFKVIYSDAVVTDDWIFDSSKLD